MKFKINVECTAQEAREFFGLPDVEEFQRETLAEVRKRTTEYLHSMDPEKLAKMWMPMGMEAMETMHKTFAQFMSASAASPRKDKSARKDKDD